MFDTWGEFLFCLLAVIAFGCGLWLFFHPIVKEVEVERIVEKPIEITKVVEVAQSCAPCTTTIERIIEKPCPEKRCVCTARGGYADNQTGGWWENP